MSTTQIPAWPLTDFDLLRGQAYIDGRWLDAESGATFAVLDPSDGAEIARVADLGVPETRAAIESAAKA